MPAIKLYPVQVFVSNKSAHRGDECGVINKILWCFRNRVQVLLKTCHEILVLEVIGDYCIAGKGLVVFSKELVVFITSSNCLWKSLSGKEYNQYEHNKI